MCGLLSPGGWMGSRVAGSCACFFWGEEEMKMCMCVK